ncbi:Sulfotransferase family protein [Thalassovita taeanensis]|uniref:Sulfotransferase family protein n=2 Tax=Thalassovita taeanensis TaxID=657014 RepID=A0A1H9G9T2_9RHOB|nr:Sulfotransferase family protein [Thalassovita taeanensis]
MALALEARAMKDDVMLGDTPKARKRRRKIKETPTAGRLWKHSTLADIEGLVGMEEIDSYFIFTLVRNPWNRAVSYYHWLRAQAFDHPAVTLAQNDDFSGFLSHPQTWHALRATPARHYMTDARGDELCDAYIRLEHFEQDVTSLEKHLGFQLQLEQVNASPRNADYRSYYSDRDAAFLADICAEDIARFGYRFDPA